MRILRAVVAAAVSALALAAPASPAVPAPPAPGAERFGDGWAVPVSTEAPEWYDAEYARRVLAAGTEGVRLPEGAAGVDTSGLASIGIRPGQWLIAVKTGATVGYASCTANFVFQRQGTYGLGTAGHCAAKGAFGGLPDVTAYVVPPPGEGLPGFFHIGKFVLARDNGIGDDFAMIAIFPEYRTWVDPTMPYLGGPTGVYTVNDIAPVKHLGHGLAIGTGGTPRTGVAPIWDARGGRAFAWYGAGMVGDSGSAVNVVTTGEGAGSFTHVIALDGLPGQIYPGMLVGMRLTAILEVAAGWSLVTGDALPVS